MLEAAYDDALGVTSAFNLNALRHLNGAIGSDFDPTRWKHVAYFDAEQSRVEMHLEARTGVDIAWPGGGRRFEAGQRIHTENSCKYTVERFTGMLEAAGFGSPRCWTDPNGWFAVFWAPDA